MLPVPRPGFRGRFWTGSGRKLNANGPTNHPKTGQGNPAREPEALSRKLFSFLSSTRCACLAKRNCDLKGSGTGTTRTCILLTGRRDQFNFETQHGKSTQHIQEQSKHKPNTGAQHSGKTKVCIYVYIYILNTVWTPFLAQLGHDNEALDILRVRLGCGGGVPGPDSLPEAISRNRGFKATEVLTKVLEICNQGPGRNQNYSILGSKRAESPSKPAQKMGTGAPPPF